MKTRPFTPRYRRRTLTGAAALLILLSAGAGAVRADERRGDRGRHREVVAGDRSGDRDGDRHRARAHRERRDHRGDRHRYDRPRHRGDSHRYDRPRHRGDRHRYDRPRHRYDRHRYDRYRHHRYDRPYYDHQYRRHHRRHFAIPGAIAHHLLHHYTPYHHGRIYFSDHRHYHDVYRFPVYTEWGVDYYPYAYCEGSFFARGVFRGGRALFDVHLRF